MVRTLQSVFVIIGLLLASVFVIPVRAWQVDLASVGKFPALESETLEKQAVQLPQDFRGERNLLLIAFLREQQKDIDTWLAQMKRYEDIDKGFRYYEIPTIEKMNPLMRWFINTGMRHGIPDKKARERTITLYIDKEPFKKSLQITDEKKIYAVVVDRSGTVLWRATGPYDEANGKSLQDFLEKSLVHPMTVPASPANWRSHSLQNGRRLRVSGGLSTNTRSQPNWIPRGRPSLWPLLVTSASRWKSECSFDSPWREVANDIQTP